MYRRHSVRVHLPFLICRLMFCRQTGRKIKNTQRERLNDTPAQLIPASLICYRQFIPQKYVNKEHLRHVWRVTARLHFSSSTPQAVFRRALICHPTRFSLLATFLAGKSSSRFFKQNSDTVPTLKYDDP